jgi:hypothetical protein
MFNAPGAAPIPHRANWHTYDAKFTPKGQRPHGWTFFAPDDATATARAERLAADAAVGVAAQIGAFSATLLVTRRA